MSKPFTFGSLFSGIGGIDLGLTRVGMQCSWQVEIDDHATKVLEKRWPNVTRFRDVRDVGAHNLTPTDLIAGGFPCQPHSLAGKRLASADERDLWGEFYRIICDLRPKYVLAENVPGVLSSESGRFFGRVLRDLAQSGYDAEWHCIRASNFGAPHRRERLFIVAYPICTGRTRVLRSDLRTIGEAYPLWQAPASLGTVWDRLSSLEQRLGQPSVWGSDDGTAHRLDRLRGLGNAVVPQIAEHIGRCILAYDGK